MVKYPLATEREELQRNTTKTVLKSLMAACHVMLTLYAGRIWQLTMMPGTIRSSRWFKVEQDKRNAQKT